MNASYKNSAAGSPSETKLAFDDDRYSTLPNPSGVEVQNALPEGSVMWDGPSPQGEGTAPAHQGTSSSFSAGGVTNSLTAVREVNLDTLPATPDAEHKTVDTTHAQPSVSSSKNSLSDRPSANDAVFVSETDSTVQAKNVLQKIDAAPPAVREHLRSLHALLEENRPVLEMRRVVAAVHAVRSGHPSAHAEAEFLCERANQLLDQLERQRIERGDTRPSKATLAGYQKDIAYLTAQRKAFMGEEVSPWFEVLASFGQRKTTFNTYRAALTWCVEGHLKSLLNARKTYELNFGVDVWKTALAPEIGSKLLELMSIRGLAYERVHAWTGEPNKPSRSRKHDLQYLDAGWLDRLVQCCASSPSYRSACVLLRFCGMRPAELEKGVVVRRTDKHIAVVIDTAKKRQGDEKTHRGFVIEASHMPQWFLNDIPIGQDVEVQVDSNGFRSYLSGLTARVLQGAKRKDQSRINLSAYLIRHAVVTEMRQNAWGSTDIAQLLGHATDATSSAYGKRSRGSKKSKPVAVVKKSLKTSWPVKVRDKSGLDKVLGKKKKKTKRQRR